MPVSRNTFLKGIAIVVLVLPAILRDQTNVAEKQESGIEIKRRGSESPKEAPAEHFIGKVQIEPLFQENDLSNTSVAYVTFEPGARSPWHKHPLGQTLIVTVGCGWVQREGGPIEEILPGDVAWFPREALAWRYANDGDDAHRDSRSARRRGR